MNNFDEKDTLAKGKIIQEHLSNINLDPWIYIYEHFINPRNSNTKEKNDEN